MSPTPPTPPEERDLGPITLRRWQPSMAASLQAAIDASLPELTPFMAWATADHDLGHSADFIARSVAEWDDGETWNYAILPTGHDDALVIGSCGLMTRLGPGVLEIGYWVHSGWTGRGHATAAAAALADIALALPGIERVVIRHDPANPASGRVAANAGFTRAGEMPSLPTAPGHTGVEWLWERQAPGLDGSADPERSA